MLITPKNAIQIVLSKKTRDAKFKPYETRLQKWTFLVAVGLFGSGLVIALITYFWKNRCVALAGLVAMLVSQLAAVAYQLVSAIPELTKLRNIEKEVSDPLLIEFNDNMDLINELSQTCEAHHLSYARASFLLMAKQLRERIALLVGAIEKVGVIPLAITSYLAVTKAQKEGFVVFGGIEWALAGLILLYLLALRLSTTAQWMELAAELYAHAFALKSKRES